MTINEYLKSRKLSYKKISIVLEIDVAHVYRALNGTRNSLGTIVKPSEDFLQKLKKHYPALAKIYLELLQKNSDSK